MAVQHPPSLADSCICPEMGVKQNRERVAAGAAETAEITLWESQRSVERPPRSHIYNNIAREERTNSSRHHYEKHTSGQHPHPHLPHQNTESALPFQPNTSTSGNPRAQALNMSTTARLTPI
jgi:hypothetical protein